MRTPDGWWVTPATVKAVLVHDGAVLLARNPRGEWELPGGRPDEGEAEVRQTLVRELLEETGLAVRVGRLVHAELFEVVPGHRLMMVALHAELDDGPDDGPGATAGPARVVVSAEHSDVRWFPLDALPAALPQVYATAIGLAVT